MIDDMSPTSKGKTDSKKEHKKRRKHPVAKVKGNWNAEDDKHLIRYDSLLICLSTRSYAKS